MLQTWGVKKINETFWDRLEQVSADVGLPSGLSDIARELDIWPSAVQKWRDGVNFPGKKNLITLALNRGCNTEWLLTGRGNKVAESAMDATTRELLQIWHKLVPSARDRLLNAARYERNATTGVIDPPEPPSSNEPKPPPRPRPFT